MVIDHPLTRFLPDGLTARTIEMVEAPRPPFPEPFLHETLAEIVPGTARLRIEAAALRARLPRPEPVGLILHTGRSGSTLLCRMLEQAAPIVTFREPEVVGQAAASPYARELVPTIVGHYAWVAAAHGRRAFLKLPSHAHQLLAELQPPPSTPVTILLRHPLDVAASMVADRPAWLDPSADERTVTDAAAAVWNAIAAIADAHPKAVVLTHGTLLADPDACVRRVAAAAGIDVPLEPVQERLLHLDAKTSAPWRPRGRASLDPAARARLLATTADARRRLARLARPGELDDDPPVPPGGGQP